MDRIPFTAGGYSKDFWHRRRDCRSQVTFLDLGIRDVNMNNEKGKQTFSIGSGSISLSEKAVDIATTHFYWKPARCLFRILELDAYLSANYQAPSPCLDLGCGDGAVVSALINIGVVNAPVVGLEYSHEPIATARKLPCYSHLVRASAEAIPFRAASFQSVVCNGVLCAIRNTPDTAISEAARVLASGGSLFLTIPTSSFVNKLLWPRWLGKISRKAATAYIHRFNERMDHLGPYLSPEEWKEKLTLSDFEVVYERSFFGRSTGEAFNLLSLKLLRPLGLLKLYGRNPPRILRGMLRSLAIRVHEGDALETKRCCAAGGYLLLVAKKRGVADAGGQPLADGFPGAGSARGLAS
jgi:ubiquinone/menaquinone biosynthesis C-methylase UbiE